MAPFQKIVDEYCKRLGVQANSFVYMIDGERINTARSIAELGLDSDNPDDNVVESLVHAQGGAADGDDGVAGEQAITLKVRSNGNQLHNFYFKIN